MATSSDDTRRRTPQWLELEREVASVYRSMGYDVQEDVLVVGSQIDLVASRRVPGAGAFRLMIEVKYTSARSLPLNEVVDFLRVARNLLSIGQATGAVLVTNGLVTPKSRLALDDDERLRLFTIADLRNSRLYDEETLRQHIRHYQGTRITQRFIDLGLSVISGDQPVYSPSPRSLLEIPQLLRQKEPQALAIFADYGAGKTTALDRLRFVMTASFLEDPTGRLPILFRLKELLRHETLDSLVASTMQRETGVEANLPSFWSNVQSGRYVFLLDGFDEIMVQPTERDRFDFLERIAPLFLATCPAVLTSRPSYFLSLREYDSMVSELRQAGGLFGRKNPRTKLLSSDARVVVQELRFRSSPTTQSLGSKHYRSLLLTLLTSSQINRYLDVHEAEFRSVGVSDPSDVRRFLDQVYDLSDLMSRPILLEMFVELVLLKKFDVYAPGERIAAAELYEIYSQIRLSDDWEKGTRKTGLSTLQRRAYGEVCAWEMNKRDTLELTASVATALVGRVVSLRASKTGAERLERIMSDLRTCSFLTIADDGSLKFIHKSFQEFFIACRLLDALLEGKAHSDIRVAVPPQSLYFLGSMALRSDAVLSAKALRKALVDALSDVVPDKSPAGERAASNLLGALMHADRVIRDVRIGSARPGRTQWDSHTFDKCHIDELVLLDLQLKSLDIRSCKIAKLDLSGDVGQLSSRESRVRIAVHGSIDSIDCAKSLCELEIGREGLKRELSLKATGGSRVSCHSPGGRLQDLTLSIDRSAYFAGDGAWFQSLDANRGVVEFGLSSTPSKGKRSTVRAVESVLLVNASGPISVGAAGVGVRLEGLVERSLIMVDPRIPISALAEIEFVECVFVGGLAQLNVLPTAQNMAVVHGSGTRALIWTIESPKQDERVQALGPDLYLVRLGADTFSGSRTRVINSMSGLRSLRRFDRNSVCRQVLNGLQPKAGRNDWDPSEFLDPDIQLLGTGFIPAEGPD